MNVRTLVVAMMGLAVATEALGDYTPPQVQVLRALQAASATPARVQFRAGFPADVEISINRPTGGAGPVTVARSFLAEFAPLYGLDRTEIELTHVRTDDVAAGRTVVRFSQRFAGFPVVNADIVVILRLQGFTATILGTSGALVLAAGTDTEPPEKLAIDLVPAITASTAESVARSAVGIPGAEVSGETMLMIYDPRIDQGDGLPRLVWRVTLLRHGSRQLLIDANSSAVLATFVLLDTSTGLDNFHLQLDDALFGNAGISCYWFSPTESIGDEVGMDSDYFDDPDAVSAFWATRDTYLMFHDRFERHSYDNSDAQLETWVHTVFDPPPDGPGEPNATGASSCGIQFSSGYVSLDVMAHEYTHMVVDETSDLASRNQSGALNEAFSDFMGVVADPLDWYIGEARTGIPGWVRHLADPTDDVCPMPGCTNCGDGCCVPCPDRYSRYIPLGPGLDSGGVHVNANIVNKASYLMVAGGTFNGRPVNPMSMNQAAQLEYEAFTTLSSYAVFGDLRNRAVSVAQLFADQGLHSFTAADVCTVRNAFRAVEIGRGDLDCNGVEDNPLDEDDDGILDDGDESGSDTDRPCHPASSWFSFESWNCDDNCTYVPNPTQKDYDGDGIGDLCELDADNDGLPNTIDPCLGVPNDFLNTDGDGLINCLDPDDDNDGILDDGDGSGQNSDHPCPSTVVTDCDDNCRFDPNPTQYDGNNDGKGDECDPDWDGDLLYVLDDNCTFVGNAGQEDADGDGIGDACDLCPNTPDSLNAYSPGYPELDVDPVPYQPDSDGDGLPDACDPFAFGTFSALNQGGLYSQFRAIKVDGATRSIQISGPAGAGPGVRLALPACGTPSPLEPTQLVELFFSGMPATLGGWVEDDSGRPVGRLLGHNSIPTRRGLLFRPRCDRAYAVRLVTESGFTGASSFFARATVVTVPGENPYASTAGQFITPPPRPPDQDGDGLSDDIDPCPAVFDPTGADGDSDRIGDVCDNCPAVPNPTQQPAEFPAVLAINEDIFAWPDDFEYNWVSGALGVLQPPAPFAALGPGGTGSGRTFSIDSFVPSCTASSCWFLWRHIPGNCGTWGTALRDAAIPIFCDAYDDCSPGESCVDGRCVAPPGAAAWP